MTIPEALKKSITFRWTLLFVLTFCSTISVLGQLRADIRFFDGNWNPVEKKESAKFYRKIKDADSVYHVSDYRQNDSLVMEGFFSRVSPALVHHGRSTWYFPNGQVHRAGYFRNGKPVGIHKEYYENGILRSEILYEPKAEFHLSYYDENGESLLEDGFGTYTRRYMNQDYLNEVFDSHLLRSYYVSDAGDTIYGTATKPAQFIEGGMSQFQKNISKSVRYPEKHRKNGNDGTVLVSFIIDRTGNMTDVKALTSLGPDFDNIAIRVVRRNRDWRQAEYNGKPVPMRFVVPVVFLHQTPNNFIQGNQHYYWGTRYFVY